MVHLCKYAAHEALAVIDGALSAELGIHRFDDKSRTKAHLFAVRGPLGRQFALVLGDLDPVTGQHKAQQTRLLLERCTLPVIPGIEPMVQPYRGSRVESNQDSKLAAPNQVSCRVADETALKGLLRWYSCAA